jgi:hypothetical protein
MFMMYLRQFLVQCTVAALLVAALSCKKQTPPNTDTASSPEAPSQSKPALRDNTATVTIDGQDLVLHLLADGFFTSELPDPFNDDSLAKLVFVQNPKEFTNQGRKIEMNVAIKQAKAHQASTKWDGDVTYIALIESGGQVFPPESGATIVITSPYTGEPGSVLDGHVPAFTATSAGVKRNVAMRFRIVGPIAAKSSTK